MSSPIIFKESNPGFLKLKEDLKPIAYKGHINNILNKDQIRNYIDTVKYARGLDTRSSLEDIAKRTLGSLVAEVNTAKCVDGLQVPTEDRIIDSTDPWQYDFDVISSPKYSSLRIEVKTSKGPTISVSTKWEGPYKNSYGVNIRGFLSKIPDLYIFYYIENNSTYDYVDIVLTPRLLCFRDCLDPVTNLVIKDPLFGWVLNHDKDSVKSLSAFHYYD